MINNRQQSGRRRGRGGQGGQGGQRQGGGAPGGNAGGGNRIDNRARGNANQLYEKYKNLAADSQRQGDRVTTEYYLQFADHYYRVLAETRPNFQEQQRERRAREEFEEDGFGQDGQGGFGQDGGSDDYADEGETIRSGEQAMQPRANGGDDRNERRFDERRPRRDDGDRPRQADGDRPRGPEEGRRPQRVEEDRPRRSDEDRRPQHADEDRPRRSEEERRPRRDREDRLNGQPRADAPAPVEARPVIAPAEVEPDLPLPEPAIDAPQPRRRGRPRKEVADAPLAFDADRLPPALNAPANDADEPADAKPRRRRTRAAASEVPAAE